MFYMRPSRYFPSKTPAKVIIDNLAYVMHTMMLRSSIHTECNGIGFLANMDGWTMKNFDVNYCFQFMMMLQGYTIPVKVELFLIVNPPTWFDTIWKIMKPMLSPTFRKKVQMISQDQLSKYLQGDYLTYLPNDGMNNVGKADIDELVEDFIAYRTYADELESTTTTIITGMEDWDDDDDEDDIDLANSEVQSIVTNSTDDATPRNNRFSWKQQQRRHSFSSIGTTSDCTSTE